MAQANIRSRPFEGQAGTIWATAGATFLSVAWKAKFVRCLIGARIISPIQSARFCPALTGGVFFCRRPWRERNGPLSGPTTIVWGLFGL
jgi:hypothetical protein